ncbi:hypothetical protein ALC53_10838 [Atta colombica]|uniref:Uncharacterized protein n=1 Tax=Atta colombica TaxID=520822 RepID=A0A195B3L2_9HYME|nr:hypothetical protein ALC53_10838 [Atta colombica]
MPPKQRGAGALCGSVFRTPTGHSFVPPVIGIGQCPFYPRRGANLMSLYEMAKMHNDASSTLTNQENTYFQSFLLPHVNARVVLREI